ELTTADYEIEVRDETGATTVACYSAPLASLNQGGAALIVVASGFLDPSANSNGADLGLYAALPTGGALIGLPACTTVSTQDIKVDFSLNVYPNPVNGNSVNISSNENITGAILIDFAGREILNEKFSNVTSAWVNIPANASK